MKKIVLPVVLLALALAVLGIFKLTRSEPGTVHETASSPDAPAPAAEKEALSELASVERGEAGSGDADREDLPAAATAEGSLETWDIARSAWIEGVVRAPSGCVDDGPVEVFATSEPVDADALARLLDRDNTSKTLLSRRKVGADGAFRIPFPPETKTGHVSVRGRFLYLVESLSADLSGGTATVTLEPACGAWIRGTIGLPSPSPATVAELDGERVNLRSSIQSISGSPSGMRGYRRRARIAEGAFEFRAIPTQTAATLEIGPTKLAAALVEIEKPEPGREVPVRVELLRGGTVRGAVRDADGHPLAGAEVEAALPGQWFGFDNREVRSGKSREDGTYELEAVAPGSLVLRASLDNYLQSERVSITLQDGGSTTAADLVLTLGNKVSGTVAWADGKPAAAVRVQAGFDRSQLFGMGAFNATRGANGNATTDAEGAFAITGLGQGPFTLQVEAPPPGDTTPAPEGEALQDDGLTRRIEPKKKLWWRARSDGIQPGASGVAMVLKAPVGVPGHVVDEQGAPVAKFKIQAIRQGKGPMGSFGEEERDESFEDEKGAFLITGLMDGNWNLHAVADGFGLAPPVPVEIPRPADAAEIAIVLEHAASVAGVVKSPSGGSIAGATVAVDDGEPAWKGLLQSGPKPAKATSLADGAFLLDGLHSGKVRLAASSKEFAKSAPVEVELATGQRLTGVEIVLRDGGVLTGEVYSDSGKPAVGMFVQAVQMKDFDQQMSFTDAKGTFRIEHLLPGSWQVVAMPSRGEQGAASADSGKEVTDAAASMFSKMKMTVATIVEGEETHVVLGAPPKDPVEVRGTVTHAGEPCAGSMVAFVPEGKEPLKGMKTSQVGKDGSYALRLDAPGHYAVSVQQSFGGMGQQSTVEFSEDIPEQKEFRLDFTMPTARISGRVQGPDGEPAAGTRVSLHPEGKVTSGTMWGGHYHEGTTDSEGRFDVQMLRAGTYVLAVGGSTFGGLLGGEAAYGREIRGGLGLSDGEWMRDVDFKLKKPGTLDVTVVDAGGAPVGEAAVFARDASGRLVDALSMSTTNADGKAKYHGLAPGMYTVTARKDLLTSGDSAQLKIAEGGSAEARVALQPGTILVVTCVGLESKPVRASLGVQDENGREVGSMFSLTEIMKMFNENGFSMTEQRIGPLPQGKYTIRGVGPDGKVVTKPVSLSGQAERKLTLRFE